MDSSDFQQNRSADSGDTELESTAQRSAEFEELLDGVPNPMRDSETELTEAEAKEQPAGLEREIREALREARAELEASPRRSRCCAFFWAFVLRSEGDSLLAPSTENQPESLSNPTDSEKSDSMVLQGCKLMTGLIGLRCSYLMWGILQEVIMTRPHGTQKRLFPSALYLWLDTS